MIPAQLILLMDDDAAFVATAAVTPFYGYFPPAVRIAKDNRITINKDNRVFISKDNRVRVTQ